MFENSGVEMKILSSFTKIRLKSFKIVHECKFTYLFVNRTYFLQLESKLVICLKTKEILLFFAKYDPCRFPLIDNSITLK